MDHLSSLPPEALIEAKRMERMKQWEEKLKQLDEVKDTQGKGVEPGIKETVAVFQLLGLPTKQSCEGHINEPGRPYPWVRFQSTGAMPQKYDESKLQALADTYQVPREDLFELPKDQPVVQDFLRHEKEFFNPKFQEWVSANEAIANRVEALLSDYYMATENTISKMLVVKRNEAGVSDLTIGPNFLGEKVTSQDINPQELSQYQERLNVYQEAVKSFTEYLKTQFMSN